jgi:di/tricarboxylate transporter
MESDYPHWRHAGAGRRDGTAKYLAGLIVSLSGDANPLWLLTGFFVLAVLLTQPMSNQAAAIVLLPVAIQTAQQAGLNPRTFAMMIAVAASTSYLTPLEPACLMVYGPGRYRFVDFFKFGSVLTLLIYVISIALVPLVWPLKNDPTLAKMRGDGQVKLKEKTPAVATIFALSLPFTDVIK